jgi:hypothetical protein
MLFPHLAGPRYPHSSAIPSFTDIVSLWRTLQCLVDPTLVHGARDSERLIGGKRHWSCYANHKISHTGRISDFLRCYRHFQTVISQFPVQHSDQPVENGRDGKGGTGRLSFWRPSSLQIYLSIFSYFPVPGVITTSACKRMTTYGA